MRALCVFGEAKSRDENQALLGHVVVITGASRTLPDCLGNQCAQVVRAERVGYRCLVLIYKNLLFWLSVARMDTLRNDSGI